MYQLSLTLGKSSGYDVSIMQVPIATAASAGVVALNIGESTGLTYGQIGLRATECMEALIQNARPGGAALVKAEMNPVAVGKSGIVFSATNALTAETGIAAIAMANGLDGQTQLIRGALVQALEVFRETVLTGGLTIKP